MPSRGPPPPENPFMVALIWTSLDDNVYSTQYIYIIYIRYTCVCASDLRRYSVIPVTKDIIYEQEKITTTSVPNVVYL